MLEVARTRHAGIAFHQGDMLDFDLGRQFDVVVCLFSSIGYVRTGPRLDQAVANMARHVCPGGVLVVEPFFSPAAWQAGAPSVGKFCRSAGPQDRPHDGLGCGWDGGDGPTFNYLVGTPAGIEHFTERHEMGLFTDEQHRAAFAAAGLAVVHDAEGLMGRGLYIGLRAE